MSDKEDNVDMVVEPYSGYRLEQPIPDSPQELVYGTTSNCYEGVRLRVKHALSPNVRLEVGFQYRDGCCWIADRSVPQGIYVKVNDKVVDGNIGLQNDDKIDIAGVGLIFSGRMLKPWSDNKGGVRLSAHKLSKAYYDREKGEIDILQNVSFSVSPGEFVGVLGPSGCGKSTLFKRILGLDSTPGGSATISGKVTINGHEFSCTDVNLRRICAYLPQNAEEMLHPGLTVTDEMVCFLAVHGLSLSTKDIDKDIDDVLRDLGLGGEKDKDIAVLSGGQKRRVAIAMTLLRYPKILVLDEPTAGLDPYAEKIVMDKLNRISKSRRITVLCSTHILENMNLFDRVLVLTGNEEKNGSQGQLVFRKSKDDLKECGKSDDLKKVLVDELTIEESNEKDLSGVYECLQRFDKTNLKLPLEDEAEVEDKTDIPKSVPPPGVSVAIKGYLKRIAKTFWSGSWALQLLLLPLGVMLFVRIGCAKDFMTPGSGALYFCCSLALFFLGLCNSASALVDERIPGRYLERLAGVPMRGYLGAKIIEALCLSVVQTTVFVLAWWVYVRLMPPNIFSDVDPRVHLLGPFDASWTCVVLFAVTFMGALVGLTVSAIVKTKTDAVKMVPIIAIAALFFSQPNLQYALSDVGKDESKRQNALTTTELFSYAMPTVIPQRFLTADYNVSVFRVKDAERRKSDRSRMGVWLICLIFAYLAVPLSLVFWFQNKREQEWTDR